VLPMLSPTRHVSAVSQEAANKIPAGYAVVGP
jgi:hypothetical protein